MHPPNEVTRPEGTPNDSAIETTIEAAVREQPFVEACVVLERQTKTGERRHIAYVVPKDGTAPDQLENQLISALTEDRRPDCVVPLSRLPFTREGEADIDALSRLPICDGASLIEWEQNLERHPRVRRAAAVLRGIERTIPHHHLGELSRKHSRPPRVGSISAEQSPAMRPDFQSPHLDRSLPLAVSHGGQPDLELPRNLAGALYRAAENPSSGEWIFVQDDGVEHVVSYPALLLEARKVLAGLRASGLTAGDPLMVLMGSGRDILEVFWGAVLGGMIPAIVPKPRSQDLQGREQKRLIEIWELLDRPCIVADPELEIESPAGSLKRLSPDELRDFAPDLEPVDAAPGDTVLFSLTSGSTGLPKCIMLSHRSLLARAHAVNQFCATDSDEVFLNWMPFDHIGGISESHLRPLLLACSLIHVPKEFILARPLRWLDLLSRYRATRSWAPNFAYALVAEALLDHKPGPNRWDLSAIKALLTAGEAVSPDVCSAFVERLAPYGLPAHCIQPAFGMAETGSGTTYHLGIEQEPLRIFRVLRSSLAGRLQVIADDNPAEPDETSTFVGLGRPVPGVTVRIVDEHGEVLPEEHVGRLQFHGAAVASGYYGNPEGSDEVFLGGGWLDSGDLAFLSDGHLAVTGRRKSTLIVNGVNFYSGEIEALVQEVDGVTPSFTAACAVQDPVSRREEPAVFFHASHRDDEELLSVASAIRQKLTRELGFNPTYLVSVDKQDIPKTQIGKIRHGRLVERFENGDFNAQTARLDILEKNNRTLPSWFLEETWSRRRVPNTPPKAGRSWLIFADPGPLLETLVQNLQAKTVMVVHRGETFRRLDAGHFQLRPGHPEDYRRLSVGLQDEDLQIEEALHLWNVGSGVSNPADHLSGCDEPLLLKGLDNTVYSLTGIARLLHGSSLGVRALTVVSSGCHHLVETDRVRLERTALSGFVKTLGQETPNLTCRHLDLEMPPSDADPEELATRRASQILHELGAADHEPGVAYRGQQRWVQRLRHLDPRQIEEHEPPFRRGGTYLLSGALKGMGQALAEVLIRDYGARLLLPKVAESDGLSPWLLQALRLSTSADVTFGPVDLRRFERLDSWVETVTLDSGRTLDGVIHLTGVPEMRTVRQETRVSLAETLDDEILAVWNLYRLLRNRDEGIFLCLSSVVGALGGATVGALAAASSFHLGLGSPQPTAGAMRSYISAWSLWTDLISHLPESTVESSRALGYFPLSREQGMTSLAAIGWNPSIRPLIGLDPTHSRLRARLDGPAEMLLEPTAFFTADGPQHEGLGLDESYPVDRFGVPIPCSFQPMREPEISAGESIELWPSVAEFYVYDDLLYHVLTHDERRNHSYQVAIKRSVKDKVVLDLGTGNEALLARFCARAGAKKIYAIELDAEACRQAAAKVKSLGLSQKIEVIQGNSTDVELPEPVDICVSEIVGPIGGCEGAAVLINDARRFLKPDGVMLPIRSLTRIAAVGVPRPLMEKPRFHDLPGTYVEKIFKEVGRPFDLRVCVKNASYDDLLSSADTFEDLDFSKVVELESSHSITLHCEDDGLCDGFLVWLTLQTAEDEVIDTLAHEYAWLPVFLPVFDPPLPLAAGDHIEATIHRTLSDNGLNPDFVVRGVAHSREKATPFEHRSPHAHPEYRSSPFYDRLFVDDTFGRRRSPSQDSRLSRLPEMPLDSRGHIDRDRLLQSRRARRGDERSGNDRERRIAAVWQDVLGIPTVGMDDNFFELGGHSLLLVQVHGALQDLFGSSLSLVELFNYPTVASLSAYLQTEEPQADEPAPSTQETPRKPVGFHGSTDIAVIGMACRFPGADDPETFWHNLREGIESIHFFTDEEIAASSMDPRSTEHPSYVKASPLIQGSDLFDAELFGIPPKEAELMDPQQRLFLEVCWEALERAGYDARNHRESVGMFAGASMNTYLLNQIYPRRAHLDIHDDLEVMTLDSMGGFQVMVASDKDYLPTQTSYRLNLTGPSINVQTACSTSLVTIHLACQSLLSGECGLCLAGGSSVQVPQHAGHLYQEGMIVSPDGHCRAFDARAEGTVFGSGVGVVVLKRLEDALASGDPIHAVIKGSAVNNDGGVKMGYMAPSSEGQSRAVENAFERAGVRPESLSMVEAHGTGTPLGDPIEVAGMSKIFGHDTDQKGFCALGSVKTNVGHLQIASGVVGFIKTVLALEHGQIPPSLHFENPNPKIDFESSPFFVNTRLRPWPKTGGKRRAGVSSLGIGGTNAFAVLEEAPAQSAVENEVDRPLHPLVLSAQSPKALRDLAERYVSFFTAPSEAEVADICFTANTGRTLFDHRAAFWGGEAIDFEIGLKAFLEGASGSRSYAHVDRAARAPQIVFLFSGQGSQYAGMARQLLETQPAFRRSLERSSEVLQSSLDISLIELLTGTSREADERLRDTRFTQPALFALEAAMADLWRSWGIEPDAVMGHSLGEYVAAYVAGVFSLEHGLRLVAERGRLMQALPKGQGMVSVFAGEASVRDYLSAYPSLSLAADNQPSQVVISGESAALEQLAGDLSEAGIESRPLPVSHAFHSLAVEDLRDDLELFVSSLDLSPPKIEFISNLDGLPVDDAVTDPAYWGRHLREPVRFRSGIRTLYRRGYRHYLEMGPGNTLLGLAAECLPQDDELELLPALARKPSGEGHRAKGDWATLLPTLAELWVRGFDVDWQAFDAPFKRRRVRIPTYPFQRRRYWFEEGSKQDAAMDSRKARSRSLKSRAQVVETGSHPLLHRKVQLPSLDSTAYEVDYHADTLPLLNDHRVFGEIVVAGSCHISMVAAAAEQLEPKGERELRDVIFAKALLVPKHGRTLQLVVRSAEKTSASEHSFELITTTETARQTDWTVHASGKILTGPSETRRGESPEVVLARCPEMLTGEQHFELQAERGIELGGSYRWLRQIHRGPGEAIARIDGPMVDGSSEEWLHPGLLDTCFGLLITAGEMRPETTLIPFGIERVRFHGQPKPSRSDLWAHARLKEAETGRLFGDIRLLDRLGNPVIELTGFDARPVDRATILAAIPQTDDEWLYALQWQVAPLPNATRPSETTSPERSNDPKTSEAVIWIVLTASDSETGTLGKRWIEKLRLRGRRVIRVERGEPSAQPERDVFHWNGAKRDDFDHILEQAGQEGPLEGVVYLRSPQLSPDSSEQDPLELMGETVAGPLLVCQSLVAYDHRSPNDNGTRGVPALVLVTRGGQPVLKGDPVSPAQSALWGLAWVLDDEHPELRCRCIDLDPGSQSLSEKTLGQIIDETLLPDRTAPRVGWRAGRRLLPALSPATLEPSAGRAPRADSTYLITGGLGSLGLKVAESLVEQGARHLVLVSRSAPQEEIEKRIAVMREAGAKIRIESTDVTDTPAVEALVSSLGSDLAGVIHCAGMLDDGLLRDLSWFRVEKVLDAKARGAWNLHRATLSLRLDFFVLFSSAVSLLGNSGQGAYAAANAYLDGLAHLRFSLGLPAVAVNWGPWSVGMAAEETARKNLAAQGFRALEPKRGLRILARLTAGSPTQIGVLDCSWNIFAASAKHRGPAHYLSRLITPEATAPAPLPNRLREQIEAADEPARIELLQKLIRSLVIEITGFEDPDPDHPLMEQGLDSLMSVRLQRRVANALHFNLAVSALYSYPTIAELALYLASELTSPPEDSAAGLADDPATPKSHDDSLEWLDTLNSEDLEVLISEEIGND